MRVDAEYTIKLTGFSDSEDTDQASLDVYEELFALLFDNFKNVRVEVKEEDFQHDKF